jgi:hypothetical protein
VDAHRHWSTTARARVKRQCSLRFSLKVARGWQRVRTRLRLHKQIHLRQCGIWAQDIGVRAMADQRAHHRAIASYHARGSGPITALLATAAKGDAPDFEMPAGTGDDAGEVSSSRHPASRNTTPATASAPTAALAQDSAISGHRKGWRSHRRLVGVAALMCLGGRCYRQLSGVYRRAVSFFSVQIGLRICMMCALSIASTGSAPMVG